jgi:septum formation protein
MPDSVPPIPMILASSSPRRQQLLLLMGLSFRVQASEVDETARPGEPPSVLAQRLSAAKAQVVANAQNGESLVIAADTMVILDGDILGKPANTAVALEMLVRLRGRRHHVYSGLALLDTGHGRACQQLAITPVIMRDYSDEEIRRYVASGDPLDKAGAYAIQYAGFDPVASFAGCYANVMGLPLCHLYRALLAWHVPVPVDPLKCCPYAVRHGCCWATEILQGLPCLPPHQT